MRQTSTASFILVNSPDSHKLRRKELLLKYPEIKNLIGYEYKTKYIASILLLLQLTIAALCTSLNVFWWLIMVYVLGATINHSIFTAIHEITHNLAFKSRRANRLFALFINLPLGLPVAMSFEKHHDSHHKYLGDIKKDGDIPMLVEANAFKTAKGKFFWLLLQPFTYAFRPMIKWPQKLTSWEIANIMTQIVFDILVTYFLGWKFLAFLILSTFIGMSFHPLATHFIAEHYVAHEQQETYSYYGILNYFTFNFGHHVEHHDFPGIPWSRTAQLKKIAPEYYNGLYIHKSWLGFMKEFITSKQINLFSRVARKLG